MKRSLTTNLFLALCVLVAASYVFKTYFSAIKEFAAQVRVVQIPERDINSDGSSKTTMHNTDLWQAAIVKYINPLKAAFKKLKNDIVPQKTGSVIIEGDQCVVQTQSGKTKECPK
ncbi:MAG: hypothetical protein FWF35_04260 [Elusimicrobia bacterium]|nr:hypothetical protein [Elusimicrobiota bacterium]